MIALDSDWSHHTGTHACSSIRHTKRLRKTIDLEPDTAAAVEELRRRKGIGLSEAVNELVRRGLLRREPAEKFEQRTLPLGLKLDVSNVADAIEVLEGPVGRWLCS